MSRQAALIRFIHDELLDAHADPPTADAELLLSGMVDSLGLMRLIEFIQDQFSCSVPYEDIVIENFESVRSIDTYLSADGGLSERST